ncbi:hypothetical protein Ahy_B01g054711 [Arachis hypogaea]|uniref:Uncharacterized protein n=1 Tax=Arachis hypogaea TaxID=3818 RepID=A0A445AUB1_ARAHY|nr:hypothetical protein Ahy_B01g054711 [Arachis hypogaea]
MDHLRESILHKELEEALKVKDGHQEENRKTLTWGDKQVGIEMQRKAALPLRDAKSGNANKMKALCSKEALVKLLRWHFGYPNFRGKQLDAIQAVLSVFYSLYDLLVYLLSFPRNWISLSLTNNLYACLFLCILCMTMIEGTAYAQSNANKSKKNNHTTFYHGVKNHVTQIRLESLNFKESMRKYVFDGVI